MRQSVWGDVDTIRVNQVDGQGDFEDFSEGMNELHGKSIFYAKIPGSGYGDNVWRKR